MVTAIVELTEDCNLGCTFCLRPSFNKPKMSLETLEGVIREILRFSSDRADFVWHGGEPLILGLDFYKNLLKYQEKYKKEGVLIRNNIQSNLTLLNQEFTDFFNENEFSIGTSIQGPEEVHNKTRIDKAKRGTYGRVVEKINKLLPNKPSAICVLTKEILGKEKETYETLKLNSSGARISEYFPGGLIPGKGEVKDPSMPTPEEYGESMVRFYELWKEDKNPINLKPITEIIRSFVYGESGGCIYSQKACNFKVIGVKQNGDFYTCLRATGKKEFLLGNFKEAPLSKLSIRGGEDHKRRLEALETGGCLKCEFWNQCNGGCPQESVQFFNDYNHKTYFCNGRKILFKHIKEDIERIENGG